MVRAIVPGWEERIVRVEYHKDFDTEIEAQEFIEKWKDGKVGESEFDEVEEIETIEVVDGGTYDDIVVEDLDEIIGGEK